MTASASNTRQQTIRVGMASLIGSALEWYDFYLYATAAALVFNKIVFVGGNPTISTLAAFSSLAVGYFVRPLGGLFFGYLGDVVGRKTVLIMTLFVMGISTVLIALVPTYESVGIWSPIILVVLRIAQGIGAGAEYSGAAILAVEHAPVRTRGFQGGLPGVGVFLGLLLSSGAFALVTRLPREQFLDWGWRLPFAASAVVVVAGWFIRSKVPESPAFLEVKERRKIGAEKEISPLKYIFRHEKSAAIRLFGSQTAENVVAYINLTFITAYASGTLGMSDSAAPTAIAIATVAAIGALIFFARLSDRWGRRPVLIFGMVFSGVFAFPYFWIIDSSRSPFWLTVVIMISLSVGVGAMFGPQGAYYVELFSNRARFTGLAFSREVSAAVSGGLTPIIAVALVSFASGASWLVALFVIMACAIGVVAVATGPETRGRDLGIAAPANAAMAPEPAAVEKVEP